MWGRHACRASVWKSASPRWNIRGTSSLWNWVYDCDGQAGIFIPGSMEIDAAKEIGANMGSSLGSSINISTDAGAQLASDLGKGVIQGVSQYISKRMRTVKVHLKSGYRVLLYQEKE